MDQASGLLTLLGRGPGIAVLPGAARRFRQHEKKKTKKKNRKKHAKALIRSIIRSFFRVFWQKNQRREALGQKIWVRVGKLGPKCPAPEDRGACENKKTDQKKRKKHAMTLIRSIIRSFFRVFWPKKKKKTGSRSAGAENLGPGGEIGPKMPCAGGPRCVRKKKNKQNRTKKNAKNTQKRRYGRKSGRFLRFFDMRVSCSGGE